VKRRSKAWKSYEEVAEYLLRQFASVFRLGRVEGKQIVPGKSGTKWELEAKALRVQGEGFLIVECRRYTKSRLDQERLAGIAFRIGDTGAVGGIVVSPLGFQKGAKLVAESSNIMDVRLDPESTRSDYILRFLNSVFLGREDSVSSFDEDLTLKIIRSDKKVEIQKTKG
jgi:hypothetical protein